MTHGEQDAMSRANVERGKTSDKPQRYKTLEELHATVLQWAADIFVNCCPTRSPLEIAYYIDWHRGAGFQSAKWPSR